jgi:hypothetical protein
MGRRGFLIYGVRMKDSSTPVRERGGDGDEGPSRCRVTIGAMDHGASHGLPLVVVVVDRKTKRKRWRRGGCELLSSLTRMGGFVTGTSSWGAERDEIRSQYASRCLDDILSSDLGFWEGVTEADDGDASVGSSSEMILALSPGRRGGSARLSTRRFLSLCLSGRQTQAMAARCL